MWDDDQEWERRWWGDCTNTYAEQTKQLTYAHRMSLVNEPRDGRWPVYDLHGRSVLDIGGGPASMLLHTEGGGALFVADPCPYPSWVEQRYIAKGITQVAIAGEDLDTIVLPEFDEVWIYNVLQHTQDPERIIANARARASVIRLFEWVGIPPHPGHPHELKPERLRDWLGGDGTVERMNENGAIGTAFYGVFFTGL